MSKVRHGNVLELSKNLAQMLRPSSRMTPMEAIAAYLRTEKGPYDVDSSPMMAEPVNQLASRGYRIICFVGPARGGKTLTLVQGALVYIIKCSPGDVQITHITKEGAREFSRKEVDRTIRHTNELRELLSPRAADDNVHDKWFTNGASLRISWPSISELSYKTLKYAIATDYDRAENANDVDGEGPLYLLMAKRTTTYMSRGKTLIESSPGWEYDPRDWRPSHPHEGPPAPGIMAVYNQGTRARLYWPCTACHEFFEAKPGLGCFPLPPFEELCEEINKLDFVTFAEQHAFVVCPHCSGSHGMQLKRELNIQSRWVHQGETIDAAGLVSGTRLRSDIVSYWQGGVSAGYQSWSDIVLRYLQGIRDLVNTGEETTLKQTVLTDQACPYVPRALLKRRSTDEFASRLEDWPRGMVPDGVFFLTAAVDVQKNSFWVQVSGWGRDEEEWLIDRFKISGSLRSEGESHAAIDPASYIEDWHLLIHQVVRKEYPLASDATKVMRPVVTFCDSGGREGVSNMANDFWRLCRASGYGSYFMLVKGASRKEAPRHAMAYPDARSRKDRDSNARGDVPIHFVNTHVIKDLLDAAMKRKDRGKNYMHTPRWVDDEYFKEMNAETRHPEKGIWENLHKRPNHAMDMHVYNRLAAIVLGIERIDWDRPPAYCGAVGSKGPAPSRPRGRRTLSGGIDL